MVSYFFFPSFKRIVFEYPSNLTELCEYKIKYSSGPTVLTLLVLWKTMWGNSLHSHMNVIVYKVMTSHLFACKDLEMF